MYVSLYMCTKYVHEPAEGVSDVLSLELQMLMSCHVRAGN